MTTTTDTRDNLGSLAPFDDGPSSWTPPAEEEGLLDEARHNTTARRRWQVVSGILTVALVGSCSLSAVLWSRTNEYRDHSDQIAAQATEIGTELARLRTEHEGTLSELSAVDAQLQVSQDRVTELAAEKAEVGDDREAQRQLADYQQRISQAAGTVASALTTCTQSQEQLIGYLEGGQEYDAQELSDFRSQVQELCDKATAANEELQRQISAGADAG